MKKKTLDMIFSKLCIIITILFCLCYIVLIVLNLYNHAENPNRIQILRCMATFTKIRDILTALLLFSDLTLFSFQCWKNRIQKTEDKSRSISFVLLYVFFMIFSIIIRMPYFYNKIVIIKIVITLSVPLLLCFILYARHKSIIPSVNQGTVRNH